MTSTTERHVDLRVLIFIALIVVVVVQAILFGVFYILADRRPTVELSPPVMESKSTALCPGNTLDYKFQMGVSRPAHIELKTSVQHLVPGSRISYARLQEFTFNEPTTMEFGRKWVVPPTNWNAVSGQEEPWQPGQYQQITVANVVGRSEVSEIKVGFSIRTDCF